MEIKKKGIAQVNKVILYNIKNKKLNNFLCKFSTKRIIYIEKDDFLPKYIKINKKWQEYILIYNNNLENMVIVSMFKKFE